jgi:hypothetical protein
MRQLYRWHRTSGRRDRSKQSDFGRNSSRQTPHSPPTPAALCDKNCIMVAWQPHPFLSFSAARVPIYQRTSFLRQYPRSSNGFTISSPESLDCSNSRSLPIVCLPAPSLFSETVPVHSHLVSSIQQADLFLLQNVTSGIQAAKGSKG